MIDKYSRHIKVDLIGKMEDPSFDVHGREKRNQKFYVLFTDHGLFFLSTVIECIERPEKTWVEQSYSLQSSVDGVLTEEIGEAFIMSDEMAKRKVRDFIVKKFRDSLKTSADWLRYFYPDLELLDFDGWEDGEHGDDFNLQLMSEKDFEKRLMGCTVSNIKYFIEQSVR